jgi:uncharacterized membrane protein
MKRLLGLLVVVASVIYPLVVYFWIQEISAVFFGLIIAGLGIAKFSLAKDKKSKQELALLIAALACAAFVIVANSQIAIKLYPVLISSFVASLFALSLYSEKSLIENMASLRGKTITPLAKIYTRKLTAIWAIVLYINALIALYLALFASTQAWALYSGLLSYVILGFFILAEIIYRQYFIAKYDSAG